MSTFHMDGQDVQILDMQSPGQSVIELRGHRTQVNAMGWSTTDRPMLATTVLLWDLAMYTQTAKAELTREMLLFAIVDSGTELLLVRTCTDLSQHSSAAFNSICQSISLLGLPCYDIQTLQFFSCVALERAHVKSTMTRFKELPCTLKSVKAHPGYLKLFVTGRIGTTPQSKSGTCKALSGISTNAHAAY
ncbi:hypothetical protein C8R48DRAFT_805993 [Suillus tomentosus]|nr:hypothetical protein C8R48DRAFT_805993 [Suillus tomentosus]